MSPDNGTLLNGLILNNRFASCSFINLDSLLPHTAYFDNNIVLPFLVFITFGSTLSVSYLRFKQYVNMFYKIQFIKNLETIISHLL